MSVGNDGGSGRAPVTDAVISTKSHNSTPAPTAGVHLQRGETGVNTANTGARGQAPTLTSYLVQTGFLAAFVTEPRGPPLPKSFVRRLTRTRGLTDADAECRAIARIPDSHVSTLAPTP